MTNLWTVLYFTLGITLTGLMLVLFKRLFRDKLSARWHYLVSVSYTHLKGTGAFL